MITALPKQIPLAFINYQQFDFVSFLDTDNALAIEQLKSIALQRTHHHLYLWGEKGAGKSHLLQATCKLASENSAQAAFVPLDEMEQFNPAMLHDLSELELVCVDNIDRLAGKLDWQQALVWLYNELRDNQHSLIMSGLTSPQSNSLELEDLRSRLGWDQVIHLNAADETQVKNILKHKAKERAFELSDEVIEFLLKRVDRDMTSLVALLDKIDHASLIAKRKITIPFIKETLSQL